MGDLTACAPRFDDAESGFEKGESLLLEVGDRLRLGLLVADLLSQPVHLAVAAGPTAAIDADAGLDPGHYLVPDGWTAMI